VGNLGQENRTL